MRIKRLCAQISTLRQGKKIVFFTTVMTVMLYEKDLPENKNVEVNITKCTTGQTDNENYSEILRNVNKSKYELSALEKHLRTVRVKLSCEKYELSQAQRKDVHYSPKNVRKRELYESRQ